MDFNPNQISVCVFQLPRSLGGRTKMLLLIDIKMFRLKVRAEQQKKKLKKMVVDGRLKSLFTYETKHLFSQCKNNVFA